MEQLECLKGKLKKNPKTQTKKPPNAHFYLLGTILTLTEVI